MKFAVTSCMDPLEHTRQKARAVGRAVVRKLTG